jgi:hypothetical protein
MNKEYEVMQWNDMRNILHEKYPMLTHADLIWRHNSIDEQLEMIAVRLGKTEREVRESMNEW